ncbi:MAG TPA: GxxExxY protein [Anaerolinea sp.]|nr:GxxExxY protein [Anaerolinea sp.]
MANNPIRTPHDEITYQIIGYAMAVHRELGPGLRENTYQRALENKLTEANIAFEPQKLYEVYENPQQKRLVGYYVPDFVVEGTVIVEIKALRGLDNSHLAQIIGYLAVSGSAIGLLINFGERSLRYRRVFPPQKVIDHLVNRQWLFVPDWLKDDSGNG